MYIFFLLLQSQIVTNENTRLTSFADTCDLIGSLSKPL